MRKPIAHADTLQLLRAQSVADERLIHEIFYERSRVGEPLILHSLCASTLDTLGRRVAWLKAAAQYLPSTVDYRQKVFLDSDQYHDY